MSPDRRHDRHATATSELVLLGDDLGVHLALFGVGCIPIVLALVRGGSWGVEAALGLLSCLWVGYASLRERVGHRRPRVRD